MVLRDSIDRHFLRKKIHSLLSRFQIRSRQTKSGLEAFRILRGLVLLFVSIVGAWMSVSFSYHESIERFQNSHWPSEQVWKQTLTARGLARHLELGEFSKLLESNPEAFISEGKIWATKDACVVYLPKSPFSGGSSELWTCESKPKSNAWINLGSGMHGFEGLLNLFEITPKLAILLKTKAAKRIDPKEIRY